MSTVDWGTGTFETIAPQLLPAAQAALDAADPQAGQHVVDVGCGTGNAAFLAARRSGVRVTGVDPASRLLELARKQAADQGLEVTFVSGEAAALPLPDGCADVVLSNFAVIFAPDAAAAVAELARVTAPNGQIVVTAWVPEGPVLDAMRQYGEAVGHFTGAAGGPGFPWHEPDKVRALFGPYGFDVTIEEHPLAFTGRSVEAYWQVAFADHPMVLAAKPVLEEHDVLTEVEERALEVLRTANEDPNAFRVTVRYLVISARR